MKHTAPLVLGALLLIGGGAQAQMFKCIVAGKVEYRGAPCDDAHQTAPLSGGTVSGVDAMPREEIDRVLRPAPAAAPRQARAGGPNRAIPTEQDIKNMETEASSITTKRTRVEKARLRAEIKAAKDLRAGGTGELDLREVDAEQARASRRRAAAATGPANLANCDGGGCWGTDGTRFNKAAGDTFFRQDGRSCQKVGDRLQC